MGAKIMMTGRTVLRLRGLPDSEDSTEQVEVAAALVVSNASDTSARDLTVSSTQRELMEAWVLSTRVSSSPAPSSRLGRTLRRVGFLGRTDVVVLCPVLFFVFAGTPFDRDAFSFFASGKPSSPASEATSFFFFFRTESSTENLVDSTVIFSLVPCVDDFEAKAARPVKG